MQLRVFSIRDEKAGAYLTPVFFASVAQALRTFGDAVTNKDSGFSKHPEDYALYEIGVYDDNAGEIKGITPKFLSRATEFVETIADVANIYQRMNMLEEELKKLSAKESPSA